MNESQIASVIIGIVVGVVGWLLKNKDAAQEKQISDLEKRTSEECDKLRGLIKTLFDKHDQDVQRLVEVELSIAQKHYQKTELDGRFERLEAAFRDGFANIGSKLDRLSEALTDHIRRDGK